MRANHIRAIQFEFDGGIEIWICIVFLYMNYSSIATWLSFFTDLYGWISPLN